MEPRPPRISATLQTPLTHYLFLRQRAYYVGTVQAPDERSAEAAAVAAFDLNDDQRKRLAVREA